MKKILLLLVIAMLTLSCLTGCVSLYGFDSDWLFDGSTGSLFGDKNDTIEKDEEADKDGEKDKGKDKENSDASPSKPRDPVKFEQNSSEGKEALTVSELYSKSVNSVAGITTQSKTTNIFGQQSTMAATGTGIVISENGYIVTNYHVVEGGNTFSVALYDGTSYDAELVGYDSSNDVALLKIEAENLSPATLGNSDEIVVGEDIVVIGNPLGELTYTLTRGVVSALNRAINTDGTPINMFQIDAAVNAGNSGGPAFDAVGNVVGMVTAKYADETIEGLGFCIPINDVIKIASDIMEYGYVRGKAALEIGVEDAYSRSMWGTTRISGAYVSYVIDGGCADNAGLKEGSLINYINNTTITGAEDLSVVLRSFSKGTTVTVSGYYNNKAFEIEVTLSEYSPDIVPDGWNTSDGIIV